MDLNDLGADAFQIGDRSKEEFIYVFNKSAALPLNVDCAGITHPMPDYYIKRSGARFYVFEQILEGKGTLFNDGKKYDLSAGDFYILEPRTEQYYFSDAADKMMQIYSLVKQTPDNEAIAYPVMNLLFSIASDLSRHAARQQEGAIVSETAKLTRFLLNESLTQKISLEDISAKLYKSKSQINREFVKFWTFAKRSSEKKRGNIMCCARKTTRTQPFTAP